MVDILVHKEYVRGRLHREFQYYLDPDDDEIKIHHGYFKEYNLWGESVLSYEGNFKDGLLHGKSVYYCTDDDDIFERKGTHTIENESFYVDGYKTGPQRTYLNYTDGKHLYREAKYQKGLVVSDIVTYWGDEVVGIVKYDVQNNIFYEGFSSSYDNDQKKYIKEYTFSIDSDMNVNCNLNYSYGKETHKFKIVDDSAYLTFFEETTKYNTHERCVIDDEYNLLEYIESYDGKISRKLIMINKDVKYDYSKNSFTQGNRTNLNPSAASERTDCGCDDYTPRIYLGAEDTFTEGSLSIVNQEDGQVYSFIVNHELHGELIHIDKDGSIVEHRWYHKGFDITDDILENIECSSLNDITEDDIVYLTLLYGNLNFVRDHSSYPSVL